MATLAEIKAQRDKVSASIDAWGVAQEQAGADATAAASASAEADVLEAAAGDSAALADAAKAEAAAEAQKLSDMFSTQVVARAKG